MAAPNNKKGLGSPCQWCTLSPTFNLTGRPQEIKRVWLIKKLNQKFRWKQLNQLMIKNKTFLLCDQRWRAGQNCIKWPEGIDFLCNTQTFKYKVLYHFELILLPSW